MNLDQRIAALVESLRDDPADHANRIALADLLDRQGPTRRIDPLAPVWLTERWRRKHGRAKCGTNRASVNAHLLDHLAAHGVPTDCTGTAIVAGVEVFVVEALKPIDAGDLLEPLAKLLPGTVHAFASRGARRFDSVRAILFPPRPGPFVLPRPRRKSP